MEQENSIHMQSFNTKREAVKCLWATLAILALVIMLYLVRDSISGLVESISLGKAIPALDSLINGISYVFTKLLSGLAAVQWIAQPVLFTITLWTACLFYKMAKASPMVGATRVMYLTNFTLMFINPLYLMADGFIVEIIRKKAPGFESFNVSTFEFFIYAMTNFAHIFVTVYSAGLVDTAKRKAKEQIEN